jgi:hypothetical protein
VGPAAGGGAGSGAGAGAGSGAGFVGGIGNGAGGVGVEAGEPQDVTSNINASNATIVKYKTDLLLITFVSYN